ncbi:efflux RND transporter permease subunit [Ottowia testudinis]|uniref:Efflux RND transporter permease subunit n=1 Tax=Ottowia testudinis TaxID=2816950 RepID=A0A975CEN8_9BURK|nr:efflux RND transporter permease subunit [Ottowia testudinis]QTD44154.1 efflux RND transporter permease subunit [Ottowia testudinis]
MPDSSSPQRLGISGRIAAYFQAAQLTPLLALVAFLLGLFAVMVTPREEEPQIDVTMANVIVPWPGAGAKDVEAMVATPAEHVLSQMTGVEHVMSVSRPGVAVLTVQFKVGVPRQTAVVRLYDAVGANMDWLPPGLGVGQPIVKPKGVDDVPIVALTLHSPRSDTGAFDLERVAHSIETEIKRVPGTREVSTIGGPGRAVLVDVDPARLAAAGVTLHELRGALQSANMGLPLGDVLAGNRAIALETGPFLHSAQDVAALIVTARGGKPVYLRDVATLRDGAPPAARYVWHGQVSHADGQSSVTEQPAVTLAVTKKPGENAIDVANAVLARVAELHNTVIPADVVVTTTRNYGETANDKAQTLIKKLLFATLSVVALVFFALGRREAAIVGTAVILTLTATLFASWAWGFTLNRVSLFALIFSIGILVDDAIVVVENIHRHQQLHPGKTLRQIIPGAVDEVGGPTILATLTVIAALLPMAFVSGLMGPYMSPIPINASMGMLLSLAIAFVVTPWLARLWMKATHTADHGKAAGHGLAGKLAPLFQRIFRPLLDARRGKTNRRLLGLGIAGLIALSVLLPVLGLVVLKMLPFDNKSEFQVVVDMPAGTPVEQTAAVLHALGAHLATVPEVTHYQAYAGTASPINFNGLVRQYYLRAGGEVGDLQVNLVDKSQRHAKSHAIAMRERAALQAIGQRMGANVKVVEVPPGPPVLAPIVAELYGPDAEGRRAVAKAVRGVFEQTPGVVDVDDSTIADAPRTVLLVDRAKAAQLGVTQQQIASTLRMGLSGDAATYLHDQSRFAVPAQIQLPGELQGSVDALLQLTVRSASGALVPIRELVRASDTVREQPIYHKDLLPVSFVVADMARTANTDLDSPLYGMFKMRGALAQLKMPDGGQLTEYFIKQPSDPYRGYALKWDGEWQITYDTFRDMGAAYAVGLILIYLLVVAQFGSYLTPLIIMAPIPLTVIGVMPGHAMLGAQFTATSMIGMIALAGIIVRNSILLVDFIHLQVAQGVRFEEAIVQSAITRAQPIILTALAAMIGALFILDDPIFNGLAIALIFGILVSTVLTLVVIPILYYVAYRRDHESNQALAPVPQA